MHHVAFVGIYDFNVFNNKLVINIWLLLFSIKFKIQTGV